ncbi:hypothetical protein RAG37_11410 [Klebsiella pneumoniae]
MSQNIAIGMGPEFRPMLRFYVTGGGGQRAYREG